MTTGAGVVGTTGVTAAQLLLAIVVPPRVTAAVTAISCPLTTLPAPVLIDDCAITWPTMVDEAPRVAELPICQNTLQACAPPASVTVLATAVTNVEVDRRINTALGTPAAFNVRLPVISKVPFV